MNRQIKIGDLVISLAGRDKGATLLVTQINGDRATVIDGKVHKTTKPKLKNPKHLKKLNAVSLTSIAVEINGGRPVGNERLAKQIKAVKNK